MTLDKVVYNTSQARTQLGLHWESCIIIITLPYHWSSFLTANTVFVETWDLRAMGLFPHGN